MKKTIFLTLCLTFYAGLIINAQKCLPDNVQVKDMGTSLVQAPDFTITTTDGVQRNLYTTLNSNKSVLLDFFFVGCGACQSNAPTIDQAYVRYGSGNGNIVFWGISDRDANAPIDQYKTTYGASNPCAGTAGNGAAVTTTFQGLFTFTGWPTYTVVCKNKTISWDVNWPPTATGFDSYFTTCGSAWGIEDYSPEKASIQSVYPLPAYNNLTIEFYLPATAKVRFDFYGVMGNKIASYNFTEYQGLHSIELPVNNLDNGNYLFTYTVDGIKKSMQKFAVMK